MVNTSRHSEGDDQQLVHTPRIRSTLEKHFNDMGIEVQSCSEGVLGRPVMSGDIPEETKFGKRKYFALSGAKQKALNLNKPSDAVIATIEEDGRVSLYLGAGLPPDQDWEVPGKGTQPGFISRAGKGLYADYGIKDENDARTVVDQHPINDNIIAAPHFAEAHGSSVQFGIIDLEKMKHRYVPVTLHTKTIAEGYPPRLLEKWNAIDKKGMPLLVVPNAVAKLAGLSMTSTKNQPKDLGNTIADGDFCDIQLPDGTDIRVCVVGALDGVGISEELAAYFDLGSSYEVKINVGGGKLIFSKTEAK